MAQTHKYEVVIRDEHFDKRVVQIPEPKASGAAIVAAAGAGPAEEFVILRHLPSGELEEILPDGTVALASGTQEIFVIRSAETFNFVVNSLSMRWPCKTITGRGILDLVRLGHDHEVVQHRPE